MKVNNSTVGGGSFFCVGNMNTILAMHTYFSDKGREEDFRIIMRTMAGKPGYEHKRFQDIYYEFMYSRLSR